MILYCIISSTVVVMCFCETGSQLKGLSHSPTSSQNQGYHLLGRAAGHFFRDLLAFVQFMQTDNAPILGTAMNFNSEKAMLFSTFSRHL